MDFGVSSRIRGWFWPLAIVVLIFSVSSRSTVATPRITNFDKLAHFGVYGLLATLVCRQTRGWRGAAWTLLAISAFGATDEWHQSYVPGRYSDIADWVADTAGAAVAVIAYTGWTGYRLWLEQPLRWRWRREAGPKVAGQVDDA